MESLKRDLFERRLWPLALVIIVAIVAVPFLLHGHRANADIAAPPAASGTPTVPASGTTPPHKSSHHRATPTSGRRDPFEAADAAKATSTTSTTTTTTTSGSPASTGSTSGGSAGSSGTAASGSPSSGTSTPVTTTPATTTPPVTTPVTTAPGSTSHTGSTKTTSWDIFSVDLRIGARGTPVTHRNIARLTPLPSERSPQVMYLGVANRGRNAVFALGAGVEVRPLGGRHSAGAFCRPSRVDCALVVIPAGKSVGLRYVSSTGKDRALVLKLSRIRSHVTESSSAVKAARRHVSAIGLCDLKLGDPIGFFDPADDSVNIPSTRACRREKLAVPFPGSLGAGSSERG
jgi:hypothetical protein